MRDDELERLAQEAQEEEESTFTRRKRALEDFRYDEQQEKYWDTTTGTLLGAKSVDGAIPKSDWPLKPDGRSGKMIPFAPSLAINQVDTGLTVEGSTWWPGRPKFLENYVVTDRGTLPVEGAACYNLYVPPSYDDLANTQNPDKWIEHIKFLWPDPLEHNHFFDFAAHMIQRPDEKVNHGVVIAGSQGIGKDTALLPLRKGVGEWNAAEIDPDTVSRQYNGYVKSVMLVINEVRPHDEDHKASNFYNQLKPLLAAPPEMLAMEVKYANTIYVRNLCHVVLTTNDPLTMYIPAEDRRLFVMTSRLPDPKKIPIFSPDYFEDMYHYLQHGGTDAVVRWLKNRDITQFNAGAPPAMTTGKLAIIESAHQVRRTVVDDVFEHYIQELYDGKCPKVVFTKDLLDFVRHSDMFDDEEAAIKSIQRKNFHFKMAERGYDMLRNPYGTEWARGKFRSRVAFIRNDVPTGGRVGMVEAELERRPLAFDSASREQF